MEVAWITPRASLLGSLKRSCRIVLLPLVFTLIAVPLVLFMLWYVTGDLLTLHRYVTVMALCLMVVLLFPFGFLLFLLFPPKYELSDGGISTISKPRLIPWKNIEAFATQPDPEHEGVTLLQLQVVRVRPNMSIPVPTDFLESSVLPEFTSRGIQQVESVQLQEPMLDRKTQPKLSLLFVFHLLIALLAFMAFSRLDPLITMIAVLAVTVLLGPGTQGILFIGKLRELPLKEKLRIAFRMNGFATFTLIIIQPLTWFTILV